MVDTAHGRQRWGSQPVPCSEYLDTPSNRCGSSYCSVDDVAVVEDGDVAIVPDEENVAAHGDCIGTCCDVWLSEMAVVAEVADPTFGNAADNYKEIVVQKGRRAEGWEIDDASDLVGSTAAYLEWVIAPEDSADVVAANMSGVPSSAMAYAAVTSAARLPSCRLTRAEETAKID